MKLVEFPRGQVYRHRLLSSSVVALGVRRGFIRTYVQVYSIEANTMFEISAGRFRKEFDRVAFMYTEDELYWFEKQMTRSEVHWK